MGKNTESEFYVIISLQVVGFSQNLVGMFYSMIPMQCPSQNSKFVNFGHFMGGIRSLYQWGGCCTALSDPPPGGSVNKISKFFSPKSWGKKKDAHLQKNFSKFLKNRPKFHFSQSCGTTPPPFLLKPLKSEEND